MTETPKTDELSFEASTERLGAIVSELERGELPLEQALALFEEGVRLARGAQRRIEQAERRIEELLGFDSAGRPITKELARPAGAQPGAEGQK